MNRRMSVQAKEADRSVVHTLVRRAYEKPRVAYSGQIEVVAGCVGEGTPKVIGCDLPGTS